MTVQLLGCFLFGFEGGLSSAKAAMRVHLARDVQGHAACTVNNRRNRSVSYYIMLI